MSQFQHVLFVADQSGGEKAALVKVLQLAAQNSGQVTVTAVVPDMPDGLFAPEVGVDLVKLQKVVKAQRQGELDDLAATAAKAAGTAKPKIVLREGIEFIEIIREATAGGYDLVAKAANKTAPVVGVLFGSLDMQLLRKCPCPVFIIKPRKKIVHARILAAVDLDTSSRKRIALDRTVVSSAAALAGLEEGSLDLLHVWHLPYEKQMRNEEKIRHVKTVDVLLKHTREQCQRGLDALAATWQALGPRTHLVKGLPHQVIPGFAKDEQVDLVVMGTVGRSGLAGFFIGNTAEKILQGLDCSVLALKPQGFKTPVR